MAPDRQQVKRKRILVGLIGDFDARVTAHQAIPLALQRAGDTVGVDIAFAWLPTDRIRAPGDLSAFAGLWCVAASPYRSMDGAVLAIRHAREASIPFLGTCGGFQHAVVEYARNVLGWADADHAETAPEASRQVISLLACELVEATGWIRLLPGTRIAAAYGTQEVTETYRCRYGLSPQFRATLIAGPLRASAEDAAGEVRGIELDSHPFFLATLFQPERAALQDREAPVVTAFVAACAA